ncbi:hypothetical protein Tco_1343886 [Tanacetum coccineum]
MAATAQNTNNTTIRYEKKMKFVEQPAGPPDPEIADPDTIDKYYESVNHEQKVACLMLSSMSLDLQRTLEKYNAYDMLKELKIMIEEQAKQELFEIVKAFNAYLEGQKKPQGAKGKDNGKNKLAYAPKPKIPPPPKREHSVKDSVCHHCKEGIFTIELHVFPKKTKVYDTGYGTHIYNTSQGLRESRKLKHEALSLYVGNGMRAAVEAIGSFDLILPIELGHFARECTGKQLDSKARYSAFKLKELDKSEEPKALLSVDSMLNWSDLKGDVSGCCCEFALMGLSYQYILALLVWKHYYAELNKDFDNLDVQYKIVISRSKFGLGFGETFGLDEVFNPSAPSIFDTTLEDVEGKPLYDSDKSSDLETTGFASCVSSVKSSSSKTNEHLASAPSSVDFKTVSKTADQQPSSTNDDSSFSFKENVKLLGIYVNESTFPVVGENHACVGPMTRQKAIIFNHFRRAWLLIIQLYMDEGDGEWNAVRP